MLNVPVGTVRSRLSRGRDMLRQLMDMKPARADTMAEPVERRTRARRLPEERSGRVTRAVRSAGPSGADAQAWCWQA